MIVVCGEALIDLVPVDGPDTWRAVCGGGPANTAVALARLGTRAALACRLSRDAFGRQLRQNLVANDVDLSLAVEAAEPASLAVVALDHRGAAEYQFYLQGTADWQWQPAELPSTLPAGTLALHLGSLAAALDPGAVVLRSWAATHRDDTVVAFDVNVRPGLLPDRRAYLDSVGRWLDVAHIAKASDDDLAWLYPGTDPVSAAREWITAHDLMLVLVTLGSAGAVAVTAEHEPIRVPGVPVDVVDTVGAGDTFTAALLHRLAADDALHRHSPGVAPLTDAVRYAVAASALACTRAGASPPSAAEVEALLG